VEELFWLEDEAMTVEALPVGDRFSDEVTGNVRVAMAQVTGRWVAAPLVGESAFRQEMVPADGLGTWDPVAQRYTVQLLDIPENLAQTILLAGCSPALSLWARSAERWHPGLRVHWLHANSTDALRLLVEGKVHAAGLHLFDAVTGEGNAPFVRQRMGDTATVLVNLGIWQEGLLLAPGNPRGITGVADVAQPGVTFINRERGAGARHLFDVERIRAGIPVEAIAGYDACVTGHQEVAEAVWEGRADAGVSTEAVATTFGLAFVPLRAVGYDLALRQEVYEMTTVQQLIATLHHRWVRSQLTVLGGYDTAQTGTVQEIIRHTVPDP
jgi:molybdate-binding protein